MVNSGMHKQDIMHKELCGGLTMIFPVFTPVFQQLPFGV